MEAQQTQQFDPLPHNEYLTEDGEVIKLINEDVLVRVLPFREKTSGGIIVPDTVGDRGDSGIHAMGQILAYGFTTYGGKKGIPFTRIPIPDLEKGLICIYIRWLSEQDSNKQLQTRLEKDVIRIKVPSIFFVADPEDRDKLLR